MVEPVSIASGAAAQVISDAVITGNTDVGLNGDFKNARKSSQVYRVLGCLDRLRGEPMIQ